MAEEPRAHGGEYPANWYPDPSMPGQVRYWDGRAWTEHVQQLPSGGPPPVHGESADDPIASQYPPEPQLEADRWSDLAENLPGQAVRTKARELRAAAPYRTFFTRLLSVNTEERAFRVGADGEEMVARRLRRLDPNVWHVLHSVLVGEEVDIDHVVIGPGGVLTLNDKHHPGKRVWVDSQAFWVNGHPQRYLHNSRREAKLAARKLSSACGFDVPVEAVIVVVGAELAIRAQPEGVHVVGRKSIHRWLSARPVVWPSETVEAVYERARRSSTWI